MTKIKKKYYVPPKEFTAELITCLNKFKSLEEKVNHEKEDILINKLVSKGKFKNYREGKKNFKQLRRNKALSDQALEWMLLIVKKSLLKMYYANPMDKDDCHAGATIDLIKYWTSFNPEKGLNAFAYCSSISYTGAAQVWKKLYPPKLKGVIISMDSSQNGDGNGLYSI